MYMIASSRLFGLDVLELLGLVDKVVGVSLGDETTLVGFLNKVLVALLLRKGNGILLRVELDVSSLQAVGR